MTAIACEASTRSSSGLRSSMTRSSLNETSTLYTPSLWSSQHCRTSGRSTITRHSDSLRGERHCACTIVLQVAASPASVHTRGRTLRSTGGRDASSAAAAACTDSSRTLASAALQHFEVEARKRSDYLAARNYRAVDDRVIEKLVMNE